MKTGRRPYPNSLIDLLAIMLPPSVLVAVIVYCAWSAGWI